jgi:hypothetical protein
MEEEGEEWEGRRGRSRWNELQPLCADGKFW